jgi:hypothetical protein
MGQNRRGVTWPARRIQAFEMRVFGRMDRSRIC